jgi:hypothetical protein
LKTKGNQKQKGREELIEGGMEEGERSCVRTIEERDLRRLVIISMVARHPGKEDKGVIEVVGQWKSRVDQGGMRVDGGGGKERVQRWARIRKQERETS